MGDLNLKKRIVQSLLKIFMIIFMIGGILFSVTYVLSVEVKGRTPPATANNGDWVYNGSGDKECDPPGNGCKTTSDNW